MWSRTPITIGHVPFDRKWCFWNPDENLPTSLHGSINIPGSGFGFTIPKNTAKFDQNSWTKSETNLQAVGVKWCRITFANAHCRISITTNWDVIYHPVTFFAHRVFNAAGIPFGQHCLPKAYDIVTVVLSAKQQSIKSRSVVMVKMCKDRVRTQEFHLHICGLGNNIKKLPCQLCHRPLHYLGCLWITEVVESADATTILATNC